VVWQGRSTVQPPLRGLIVGVEAFTGRSMFGSSPSGEYRASFDVAEGFCVSPSFARLLPFSPNGASDVHGYPVHRANYPKRPRRAIAEAWKGDLRGFSALE